MQYLGALGAGKREGPKKVHIVSKSPVFLHGMRPVDEPGAPELAFLSPCDLFAVLARGTCSFPLLGGGGVGGGKRRVPGDVVGARR